MYTLSQKIERLKSCRLFETLGYNELKAIALAASDVVCAPGDLVFTEGEPGRDAFLIFEGAAEATATLPSGETIGLATFGPSDLFGEFSLIGNCPRTATVRSAGGFRGLRFDKDAFLEIATRSREVALRIMDFLVKRLLATQERLLKVYSDRGSASGL